MKRNTSIDVFRVLLMFGICLLHSITMAGHNTAWAANALQWCVPGFVFISGWFGIRFSVGKVLKLYGISLYCAVAYCVFDFAMGGAGIAIGDFAFRIWRIATGQWFLNAYAVLMCFAPLLNEACVKVAEKWTPDRRGAIAVVTPLLLCAFGWSFATTLPVVSQYVPHSTGLTAYSFLTLIGVYVVARTMRELDRREIFPKEAVVKPGRDGVPSPSAAGGGTPALPRSRAFATASKVSRRLLLVTAGVCLVAAAIGLGDYNSPFAVTLAGCAFLLVRDLRVPEWIGNVCVWLAPTMFSVYLIHSHGQAWGYLAAIENAALAQGLPLFAVYVLTALCVFVACVILDLPRRLFVRLVTRQK